MKKDEFKVSIDKLLPDEQMEHRLADKVLKNTPAKTAFRTILALAASIAVMVCLGAAGYKLWDITANHKQIQANTQKESNAKGQDKVALDSEKKITQGDVKGAVTIPKVKLPEKTDAAADMGSLIVYQGRIYTATNIKLGYETSEKLCGEKLGTTKGNIDEWSSQEDYAVDLASTMGYAEVYSVKGYDKSFRIMVFAKGRDAYGEFFECLNGITVVTGADVFNKFKLEGNVRNAKFQIFENWNNGGENYTPVKDLQAVETFVTELKNTKPFSQESLSDLFLQEGNDKQKFLYMTLNDGSEIELRLFKNGYLFYWNAHIFFKMEDGTFSRLWDELR